MGVSRWGGPESREYPAFSMATRPIRQPPTTKADLPCVAYAFSCLFLSLFFLFLIFFYLSLLPRLSIRFPFHRAIFCVCFFHLLSAFFFPDFVHASRKKESNDVNLYTSLPLDNVAVNLTCKHKAHTTCLCAMYACLCACVYIDTGESHIDFADD